MISPIVILYTLMQRKGAQRIGLNSGMVRPCFLVIDREFPGSISTRKLVIETAKFNVLTAYSGVEARETFERFPAINGVVLDAGLEDISCTEIVREIKAKQPKLPVIVIGSPNGADCAQADFWLDSFQPAKLLEILSGLIPEASDKIEKRNEELSREHLS
jgi:DNA-binding response OmpR family regulator